MRQPDYKLALSQNEFESAIYSVNRNIIRAGRRDIIAGKDQAFVLEEVNTRQEATGRCLEVTLGQVIHKKLSEVTINEIWASGIDLSNPDASLKRYAGQLSANDHTKHESWLKGQLVGGHSPEQVLFLLTLQKQSPTINWNSDVTIVPFGKTKMIAPEAAKTITDAARAEHKQSAAQAGRSGSESGISQISI